MSMFDENFVRTIERGHVGEFDSWIRQWGVEHVVERSSKNEHIANKHHWIAILMHYFPTMRAWALSGLCAQSEAEYVFDRLFNNLIINDNDGLLSKRCNTVFSQHMFEMTHLKIWQTMDLIVSQHQNGLLTHILQHPDFQKYLTSRQNDAQKGMRTTFSKMIVASRNVNQSSWTVFRDHMPPYNCSWLIPYVDSLLQYRFDGVVANLLGGDTFKQWSEHPLFVQEWAKKHSLTSSTQFKNLSFLNPEIAPIYHGTVLWNSIVNESDDCVVSLVEFGPKDVPFEHVVLECFQAAERSVKGLRLHKKHDQLRRCEDNMIALFDALDDQTLRCLVQHKTDVWDWINISNNPRVLSHTLHAAVEEHGAKGVTVKGRKI